jgi:hypothetical protein
MLIGWSFGFSWKLTSRTNVFCSPFVGSTPPANAENAEIVSSAATETATFPFALNAKPETKLKTLVELNKFNLLTSNLAF